MNAELENEEVDIEVSDSIDDDENENEYENPNIEDQLQGASGQTDAEPDRRTPEERYKEFSKTDPEAAEEYSKKVQDRINKLTYKHHEAERQREAAIEFAQNVQRENEQLKKMQIQGQHAFLGAQKAHLNAELEQAKALYKEAHHANDPELMAEANQNISKFSAQLSSVEQAISRAQRSTPKEEDFDIENRRPVHQTQVPQRPARTEPDEKAQEWGEKNDWFGKDQVMTQAALAIHQQMVSQEGFLATSDAYYEELDNRIRKNFPHKFQQENQQSTNGQQTVTTSTVTSGNRPRNRKRTVKLTASQIQIAKKLGVPLEEYAKYV